MLTHSRHLRDFEPDVYPNKLLLKSEDTNPIVQDTDLFFRAYSMSSFQKNNLGSNKFFEAIKNTSKDVEKIRIFFAKAYSLKSDFKIYLIPGDSGICYLIDPSNKSCDEKQKPYIKINSETSLKVYCYDQIEPFLGKLAMQCGAIFSKTTKKRNVLRDGEAQPTEIDIDVLKFKWEIETLRSFELKGLESKEYDCELFANDGGSIEMHSALLPLKLRFTTQNKQFIQLNNYNFETIRAYVNSVYMNAVDFETKYINKRFPVCELLNFSVQYSLFHLEEMCIKIICHQASTKNLKDLLKAIKICRNERLESLYRDLTQTNDGISP